MTVLVTGGAGYIGSHMVHALVDAGESVVVIDNLSTGFSAFLPDGVPLFIGDAGDENLVEGVIAQHGIDSIIHFAKSLYATLSIVTSSAAPIPPLHHASASLRVDRRRVRS